MLACAIAFALCLSSCEEEGDLAKLKKGIEYTDSKCPVTVNELCKIVSAKYDDESHTVQLKYSIEEELFDFDEISNNKQSIANAYKLVLSGTYKSDKNFHDLLDLVVKTESDLSITFLGANSGKSIEIPFSADDLEEIINNPLSEKEINEKMLKDKIETTNAALPTPVYDGVEIVEVRDDGANIVFSARVDEEVYDFNELYKIRKSLKEDMIEEYNNDAAGKSELKLYNSLGRGIVYHYYGDTSGESFDVRITNDEIKEILDDDD